MEVLSREAHAVHGEEGARLRYRGAAPERPMPLLPEPFTQTASLCTDQIGRESDIGGSYLDGQFARQANTGAKVSKKTVRSFFGVFSFASGHFPHCCAVFFLHRHSQIRAGMPPCPTVFPVGTAIHERFRCARACQISDVPVLLPGMLVHGLVHGMQGVFERQMPRASAFPLRRAALTQKPRSGMR